MQKAFSINDMGSPDIKLGELKIWIHVRQFPEVQQGLDANWLNITAMCKSHGAEVWTSGPIIELTDLEEWVTSVEEMHRLLKGSASGIFRTRTISKTVDEQKWRDDNDC